VRTYCALLAIASSLLISTAAAEAATATGNIPATITIEPSCQVASSSTLDFGSTGALVASLDVQSNFVVQCSDTTPFNVALDGGSTPGGTVATRLMAGGSGGEVVSYQLYSDPARTANWGNTVGADTVSGTGNGSTMNLTVYGRVPAQATPSPGTYSDTVMITISY
jgi:spore coat protein U-like protein